jgi:hypothetical protein
MKFLLVIQICSAIMQQCTEPVQMNTYNSHYDCATAGFLKGITVLRELGEEYVNDKHMLMNFACTKQEAI